MRVNQFEDAAGVGKIAGKGQENDPRYKTSLTVDVHPDTVAKEIAAFFPTKPPKTGQHHIKETDMKKINEVDPRNYDSDEDYYNALRRKPQKHDDYDPPMADDLPSDEDQYYQKRNKQQQEYNKKVSTSYSDHEGVAPNGEKYNSIMVIKAANKTIAENELYNWKNFHYGAKKIVDIKQVDSKMENGPVEFTVYYVDNHKYGTWKPWQDQPTENIDEKWSQKYKDSINCSNPKGFSQKAHCAGRKKNEDVTEAGEWTKLPNGNYRNMHTGVQQSTPPKTKRSRMPQAGVDFSKTDLPPSHPQSAENVWRREQGMAEGEFELAGIDVAYELGRRAFKQGATVRDNPYSHTKEARKADEWEKGLRRGREDAFAARRFRDSIKAEAVTMDRNKQSGYPNDPATQQHRLATAKALLSDPKTDPDSRSAAAAVVAQYEKQGVAESSAIERKINRTRALIQDYYKRARASSNDIKRDHYIDMARQLEYELDGMIHDAEQDDDEDYYALPMPNGDRDDVAEGAPIVVMPSHKRLEQKPKSSLTTMAPAKQRAIDDAKSGKPYNNPYPFKPELGAPGNEEHNLYKATYNAEKKGVAEGSGQPTMRRVTHEKISGNGDMVKVVTYEVLNSQGVTVKTGMTRETAASLLKHLKQQGN